MKPLFLQALISDGDVILDDVMYVYMGYSQKKLEDSEGAALSYQAALGLNQNNPNALRGLAEVLVERDSVDEVIDNDNNYRRNT